VKTELSQAEPLLHAAKESVQNISDNDLRILRGFGNPPILVKLTLEAVVCVLTS